MRNSRGPGGQLHLRSHRILKAQFITASAVARQMLRQGSGVIIFLTGSPGAATHPGHLWHRCRVRCRREPHPAHGDRTQPRRRASDMPEDLSQSRLAHDPGPDRRDRHDDEHHQRSSACQPRRQYAAEGIPAHDRHGQRRRVPRLGSGAHDDRDCPEFIGRSCYGLGLRAPIVTVMVLRLRPATPNNAQVQ